MILGAKPVNNRKPATTGEVDRRSVLLGIASAAAAAPFARGVSAQAATPSNALASWNEGPAKQAILDFVRVTTNPSSKDFVTQADRIATFDQDGTLWVEQPLYTQAMFALDRLLEQAPKHPEWKSHEPFKSVLANDMAALAHFTEKEWAEIIFTTHSGMSETTFLEIATQWIATAKHPKFKRLYTDLVYQPMIELLTYLRANQFETYIVTGGGQDFVRAYAERVYGIAMQKIIGSSGLKTYEMKDGKPELMRLPKLFFDNNYGGKPVGIDMFIGKRPRAAFGNSTGDREMLEWTGAGDGARLNMLVLHDDPVREYAYGPANGLPDSKIGMFDQPLLDEAKSSGWSVISMKNDWTHVFAA